MYICVRVVLFCGNSMLQRNSTFTLVLVPAHTFAGLSIVWVINLMPLHYFCRPKHPVKVHVWPGISKRGRTGICIFDGTMDAVLYISILRQTLLPFIQSVYPLGHKFMQDNDPKHTSRLGKQFFDDYGVNW